MNRFGEKACSLWYSEYNNGWYLWCCWKCLKNQINSSQAVLCVSFRAEIFIHIHSVYCHFPPFSFYWFFRLFSFKRFSFCFHPHLQKNLLFSGHIFKWICPFLLLCCFIKQLLFFLLTWKLLYCLYLSHSQQATWSISVPKEFKDLDKLVIIVSILSYKSCHINCSSLC